MYQVNTSKSRKKMKNKMEVPERRCREIDKKKITKICRDPNPQQLLIFFLCKIKIVVIERERVGAGEREKGAAARVRKCLYLYLFFF